MDWLFYVGIFVVSFVIGYTVGKIRRMVRGRNCEALAKFLQERSAIAEREKGSKPEANPEGD